MNRYCLGRYCRKKNSACCVSRIIKATLLQWALQMHGNLCKVEAIFAAKSYHSVSVHS